jgi:hypothetical protein
MAFWWAIYLLLDAQTFGFFFFDLASYNSLSDSSCATLAFARDGWSGNVPRHNIHNTTYPVPPLL